MTSHIKSIIHHFNRRGFFQNKDNNCSNYYEYEISLKPTPHFSSSPNDIWPDQNEIDIDNYELDFDNLRIIGRNNKKIIKFGYKVRVKITDCNLSRRTIDLELIN